MAFETTKKIRFEVGVDGADKVKAGLRGISDGLVDTQRAVGVARSAFVALASVAGTGAFVGLINGAIDAKAKLYDLGLQTGISVEALGGLSKVAQFSNTSLDEIASASAKLGKALATTTEDSKGAAQAIKALGLNYEQFSRLGADEQLLAVARAMEGFEDGTDKAAAAMLLFGKTGATLLPFMKELAERGIMVSRETTASAAAAKQYQDNLVELRGAGEGFTNQLAAQMLPALVAITNEFIKVKGEGGQVNGVITALRTVFETVTVLGANVAFVFAAVGREIGAVAAQGAALARGDFAGFRAISQAVIEDGQRARAELEAFEKRLLGIEAVKARITTAGDFQRGDKDTSPAARRRLPSLNGGAAARDDFTPLLRSIAEKTALQRAEFEGGRALTEAQKFQAKVFADVDGGYLSLTISQKLAIDQHLQELLALEQLNAAYAVEVKWLDQSGKETARTLELQDRRLQAMQDETAAVQLQLQEYGLSHTELLALERARTLDSAALLRQRAAVLDTTGPMGDLRQLYLDQAQALEDLAALRGDLAARQARDRNDPVAGAERAVKDYLEEVKQAGIGTERAVGNALRGLEDGMTQLFTKGRFDARSFIDSLLSEFIRLRVVKPLLADLFSPGGGTGGGTGGGGIFSLFSSLGSIFGGTGFGGGLAGGGPAQAGTPYLVGERGPELFVPRSAGTVVPNGAGRSVSVSYAPVINVDSRSDRAQVAQIAGQAAAEGNRRLLEMLHARGAV